jgi:hypothetical protein
MGRGRLEVLVDNAWRTHVARWTERWRGVLAATTRLHVSILYTG